MIYEYVGKQLSDYKRLFHVVEYGFDRLPPGTYDAVISAFEFTRSEEGYPAEKCEYTIASGQYAGHKCWSIGIKNPQAYADLLGVDPQELALEAEYDVIALQPLVGYHVWLEVTQREPGDVVETGPTEFPPETVPRPS